LHPLKRIAGALLALVLLLFPLGTMAEETSENLIWNPNIASLDYWYEDAWDLSSGISSFALADIGYDDSTSLYVENTQANDARFIQDIWVEPDTMYRISCYVMAEGCGEDTDGANISVLDTFASSETLHDTNGQWQYLELYGETGPDQTELTVMARLGGYSSTNTGKAWFDNFEMTAVDSLPEGALLYDFATIAPAAEPAVEETDEEPARNTPTLILIAVLFVVLACAGWASVRRMNEVHPDLRGHGEANIFSALLFVAFAARVYLALRYPGYRVDINCFEAWSSRMATTGLLHFYDPGNYFCDYPPVYLLLLTIVEWLRRLLDIAYDGTLHRLLIRIWPIVCDLFTAALIYRVGKKRLGETSAAALGTLHAFNITAMAISAAWGQADSVLTLLLAVTLLLAIEKKWTPALICYALAVLTKPQALLFAPVGVTFFLCDVVRTPHRRGKLLLSAGIGIGVAYLIMLPFSINLYEGAAKIASPVLFLIDLFSGTTSGYSYMTVNALNLYSLLDLNWANTANHSVLYIAAWVMMIASIVYGCWLTVVNQSRRSVLLTSAAVISLIFAFGPMMHERYLFPCIVLLMLYYALGRDRRVLYSALITSATLFLNTTLVLQGGMGTGNYGHLNSGEQWLNAIVSLVNVLNALYLAYISFRICVQRSERRNENTVFLSADARRRLMIIIAALLVLLSSLISGTLGQMQANEILTAVVRVFCLLNVLYLVYLIFRVFLQNQKPDFHDRPAEDEPAAAHRLNRRKDARLHLTLRDYALMVAVTVVYAVVAFTNLGDIDAPQTEWVSVENDEQIVFDLGETQPFRMTYYGGICNTHFTVALSNDGEIWSEDYAAEYAQGQIFRWLYYTPQNYDSSASDKFTNAYADEPAAAGAPITYFVGDELPEPLAAFELSTSYPPQEARYVRITAYDGGLKLRELGFLDAAGEPLPVSIVSHETVYDAPLDDAAKLIDEQHVVPAKPTYLNSTYFDEIYHARTAYEHQQGLSAYEWTHPPLGKVLMMVGINIFGMTPFGWRFMGTLIGVLMVPLMYLLARQLTHRTSLSFIAMALIALDSMHFTQTRIATVDSFGVFFIMLMYLFMFRYQQMNWNHDGLKRTLIPLGLCGISMGLGIAAKWIGVYAGVGLGIIFFCCLWQRFSEYRYAVRIKGEPDEAARTLMKAESGYLITLVIAGMAALLSLLLYVVPRVDLLYEKLSLISASAFTTLSCLMLASAALFFACSFILYRRAERQIADTAFRQTPIDQAQTNFWRNTILTGLFCVLFFIVIPLLIYYFSYYWQLRGEAAGLNLNRVVNLQESMFSYHAGLGDDDHYFRSEWYEWPIIWWPIWFYSGTGYQPSGMISSISCMGNPAVWWTGLAALIATFYYLATKKRKPESYSLVVIAFLSQFLPWVLVPRSTFIYHYFASVPFIILCTSLMLDRIRSRSKKTFITVSVVLLAAALILFIMFYPLESGLPVSREYAKYLRWFKWYNF